MKKTAIFVDVQNVYYTVREQFGCNFDYNVFWEQVTADRELVFAAAYAIARPDQKQKQFQNILRGIGFMVKLKPFIRRHDGSAKGDWDVGITLDVIEKAEEADVIVLVSGDGDYSLLADKARSKYNCEFEVYGVEALTADSLIEAASEFVPIKGDLLLKKR